MLWAGVPMVTYPGETMASRAAASFSTSVGAPEMYVVAYLNNLFISFNSMLFYDIDIDR